MPLTVFQIMRKASVSLFLLLILVLLGLWMAGVLSSPKPKRDRNAGRPHVPWVFRSVLDLQPRMVTFALHDNLWVSYSTDSCSLYKAWMGGVNFEGAVFNMRHGPQPTTYGKSWFVNRHAQPWTVEIDGKSQSPRTDYRGHRFDRNGRAEIFYDLVLDDNRRIRINESPEYLEMDLQPGLERVFSVETAPTGAKISLHLNAGSLSASTSLETDGQWQLLDSKQIAASSNIQTAAVEGILTLKNKGKTRLKTMFVRQPVYNNPNDSIRALKQPAVAITPGERLMGRSDCATCHNPQRQTVGPAYVDIAKRYKNTPENLDKLAQKVIKGGAGNWGVAAMSSHPDLQPDDAKAMIAYVLSLDEGEDDGESGEAAAGAVPTGKNLSWRQPAAQVPEGDLLPGLMARIFTTTGVSSLDKVNFQHAKGTPLLLTNAELGIQELGDYRAFFALEATGYLRVEKDDNVVIQLASDDGSRLYLDDKLLIDNDGEHGMEPMEAEVALRAGFHTVKLQYFQNQGGRGLSLRWARFSKPGFHPIAAHELLHVKAASESNLPRLGAANAIIPGDGVEPVAIHPSFDLSQARPNDFLPKVGGMDFMSDGSLIVSTWDPSGSVYRVRNVQSGQPDRIKVQKIAEGLAEPLGIKVVDDTIFVLQKQELTQLVDLDHDGIIDEYRCFAKGWKASANFHEFAFGLAFKDDYFYATLAIAIMPGGASARPQLPDRGKVVRISRKDGSIEFIARGLRTPNGIGMGVDNELFVADNQGDWLPSSKILHVKNGAFYNSYAVDSAAVANLPVQPPVVWLPQDEIGNSPSQPSMLRDGPYAGQMVHGEVTHGGLKRVFVEKVNGDYQGCVFRFCEGLEAGINRLVWGPDGALYVGGIGNPGNWGQEGKRWYGLQRLKYNGNPVFEMLAVRARANGLEVEFTEPLAANAGWNTAHYQVKQWWYKPTYNYGGPKMDEETLPVKSATVSADRKKVFLEMEGMKTGHVVYLRLKDMPPSEGNREIWTTEAWYTLNQLPALTGQAGAPPASLQQPDNTLSEEEKKAGWTLLFDGKTIDRFRNYGKSTIGKSWIIDDNAIHLDARKNPQGHWQAPEGGDIVTQDAYENFELTIDWKIIPCGNSGIIYHVVEDPSKYQNVWNTGPEMQVLDNACHPDSRFPKHRAGDLYDLISCKFETVKPAGSWNHARLVSNKGHVEHWLNNYKVVEYDMNTEEWPKLIAGSKFKDMSAFGKAKGGHIALQDHGDKVWYKNIKIRKIN